MFRINQSESTTENYDKSVKTVISHLSGGMTVEYRLLRGYCTDPECFVYSLLISLYDGRILEDEEFAFDVTRDAHDAETIFGLAIRHEIVPSSFNESFEFIIDNL